MTDTDDTASPLRNLETELQDCLEPFLTGSGQTIYIAYSGGLDSHVLLHCAWRMFQGRKDGLVALHVDHGLHPGSTLWRDHCRSVAQGLNIDFRDTRVDLGESNGDVESRARRLRYQWFSEVIGDADLLLTAHHQRDQAETLLLNLARGSGLAGMAAMPVARPLGPGMLVRPLVNTSHATLASYADRHRINSVEDPSNADTGFDRNYLRHRIFPLLADRWTAVESALARSSRHAAEASELINQLAQQDLVNVTVVDVPNPLGYGPVINRQLLGELTEPRIRNLLRYWVKQAGFPALSEHRSRLISAQFQEPNFGFQWQEAEILGYRHLLYLNRPLSLEAAEIEISFDDLSCWRQGGLSLQTRSVSRGGLDPDLLRESNLLIQLGGSQRFLVPRAGASPRPLKKFFQKKGIPEFLRPYYPLISRDGTSICIPGVWNSSAFVTDESGVTLDLNFHRS